MEKEESIVIRGRDSKVFIFKSGERITLTVNMIYKNQVYGFSQALLDLDIKEIKKFFKKIK